MFAVVKAGGKQYRVAANDVIKVSRLEGEPGDAIELGEALILGGDNPTVCAPTDVRREVKRMVRKADVPNRS